MTPTPAIPDRSQAGAIRLTTGSRCFFYGVKSKADWKAATSFELTVVAVLQKPEISAGHSTLSF